MMRVVYIAGKFRGATPWQVQQNVRAAEEVAAKLAERAVEEGDDGDGA